MDIGYHHLKSIEKNEIWFEWKQLYARANDTDSAELFATLIEFLIKR